MFPSYLLEYFVLVLNRLELFIGIGLFHLDNLHGVEVISLVLLHKVNLAEGALSEKLQYFKI